MIDWNATTTTGNPSFTSANFDIDKMLATAKRFQVTDEIRRKRAYFEFLGMVCGACGASVLYRESPESITVCRCLWDQMREVCEKSDDGPTTGMGGVARGPWNLYGIDVHVRESVA